MSRRVSRIEDSMIGTRLAGLSPAGLDERRHGRLPSMSSLPPSGRIPRHEADPMVEAYKRDIDRTLLRENLRRSVEERLRDLMRLQRFADEWRRAARAAFR
jgi:hypothetical protein